MSTDTTSPVRISDAAYAKTKAIHSAARAHLTSGEYAHRTALLAWLFVRGLSYRTGERHRHVQLVPPNYKGYGDHQPKVATVFRKGDVRPVHYIEHNKPSVGHLHDLLVSVGAFEPNTGKGAVERWLSEAIDAKDLVPLLGRKLDAKDRMAGIVDEPTVEAGPVTLDALVAASVADAAE